MNVRIAISHLAYGALIFSSFLRPGLRAQTITPDFASAFSLRSVSAIPGLPPFQGGLLFKLNDPDTVLVVGNTGSADASLYSCKVTRDATGHINGFTGTSLKVASLAGPTGGGALGSLSYGPNGTVFFSTVNDFGKLPIGQLLPGGTSPARFIDLRTLGIDTEGGEAVPGIVVVPAGAPGAGRAKLLLTETGVWLDATLSAAANNTYDIHPSGNSVGVSGTTSAIYIPAGQPKFPKQSVLLTGNNNIRAFEVNENGDPLVDSQRVMIEPLDEVVAAARDPRSGDLLITTSGGALYLLGGFKTEAPRGIITQPVSGTTFEAPAAFSVIVRLEKPDALISKIELRAGSTVLQSATVPPETPPVTFLLKDLPAGNYSFTAVTYDPIGNAATSAPVTVTITNRPPAGVITSPANNANVLGCGSLAVSVTLTAGSFSLSQVHLLAASVPLLSVPAAAAGSVILRLPDPPSGSYALQAIVTDTAGFRGTSAPVQIYVTGPPTNQLAASLTSDQHVLLCFQGLPDMSYVLEGSLDMLNWLRLWTNRTPSGAMTYVDTNPAMESRRFFRMRSH